MDLLWALVNSYGYGSNSLSALWIVLVIVLALIVVLVFLRFVPVGLWITSLAAGVHVSIGSLAGMRLRRTGPFGHFLFASEHPSEFVAPVDGESHQPLHRRVAVQVFFPVENKPPLRFLVHVVDVVFEVGAGEFDLAHHHRP